jgi:hypothetical protein
MGFGLLIVAGCVVQQPAPDNAPVSRTAAAAPADAGVAATPADAAVAASSPPSPADAAPPADAAAAIATSSPLPKRVPAGAGCVAQGSATISQLQQRAAAWSRASLDAELARQGLARAAVGQKMLELHRGIRGAANGRRPHPLGTLVTTSVAGVPGTYLAGLSQWSGNARQLPAWELISRGDDLYRMVRQPQPRATEVVVCGCEPRKCGPYGSGCPACGSTSQRMYGPLPASTNFHGDLTVSYPAAEVVLRYQNQSCPPPRRCPAPPPSAAPRPR